MRFRFRHMTRLAAAFAALFAAACEGPEGPDAEAMGTAHFGVVAPQVFPFELTRVSVESDTGFSIDLARDPGTGTFVGTLLLPAEVTELTGFAFVGDELVGASNPVPADIQPGVVTRVTIQILDTTGGGQPGFGPLLESLSHPTTTTVDSQALFAVSFLDPDGTPMSIDWSDDCDDSTFTAPQSAVTGWTKATPGGCRVTVTGTAGGQSASASFSIVAFPAGTLQGGAEIVADFIAAPVIDMQLTAPDGACSVNPFSANASCAVPIASPTSTTVRAFVGWQNGTPGELTIFDDCGGNFSFPSPAPFIDAIWLPPVQGGLCRITARAVNQEGVVGEISMAVVAAPGTPRQPVGAPQINVSLSGTLAFCFGSSASGEVFCGPLTTTDAVVNLNGSVFWDDTLPGKIAFADSCGGTFVGGAANPAGGFFSGQWQPPAAQVRNCTMTVTGTSLEGVSRSVVYRFDVL